MTTFSSHRQFHSRLEGQRLAETEKRPRKVWRPRPVDVSLEQRADGEWYVILGDGEGVIATDAEIALWRRVQQLEAAIKKLQEMR